MAYSNHHDQLPAVIIPVAQMLGLNKANKDYLSTPQIGQTTSHTSTWGASSRVFTTRVAIAIDWMRIWSSNVSQSYLYVSLYLCVREKMVNMEAGGVQEKAAERREYTGYGDKLCKDGWFQALKGNVWTGKLEQKEKHVTQRSSQHIFGVNKRKFSANTNARASIELK